MNSEYIWFLVPICGLLWALGGTFKKQYRRLGVPISVTLVTFLYSGWSWWLPVLFGSSFLVTTLPFTLSGNEIGNKVVNWIWIWVLGFILGLPCLMVGIMLHKVWLAALLCLIPCIAQGIVGSLSNWKPTAKFFPWKFCEIVIGSAFAIPYAILFG